MGDKALLPMKDMPISILGCGWLGLPLARRLAQRGYPVKGSTTTQNKRSLLEASNIVPFLMTASPQLRGEEINSFFQSKILILTIPFKRALEDPCYYKQQVDSVITRIEPSPVEFVIFTSSTSVYPASRKSASEEGPLVPDNPRSKILQEIEQSLLTNQNFQTTVIRYSGMYGGTRKIGRIFAGRGGLADGGAPVNLIHLDDCIEIVVQVIQKDIRGAVFNACSDGHPTRKEIYTKAAYHYGLQPPRFCDQPPTRCKVVCNAKLKEQLGYTFIHPDPMVFE